MVSDVARLSRTLGPLRRALLHAIRKEAELPDVPEAHIEVLRLLESTGPLTSMALAQRLHLARSTISNLLKTMMSQGLLEARPVPDDLRSVSIGVTPQARRKLQQYDEVSTEVLGAALDHLSPEERAVLATATPVLEKLTARLAELA